MNFFIQNASTTGTKLLGHGMFMVNVGWTSGEEADRRKGRLEGCSQVNPLLPEDIN